MHRPLIIIGCGRSGTTYTAKLLQSAGLDFRHEDIGVDGGIGWNLLLNPNLEGAPMRRVRIPDNAVIMHQVREPLAAISSMLSHQIPVFHCMAEVAGPFDWRNKLTLAASAYIAFNQYCARLSSYTLHAEQLQDSESADIGRLCQHFGISPADLQFPPITTNSRKHAMLTADDLADYPELSALWR